MWRLALILCPLLTSLILASGIADTEQPGDGDVPFEPKMETLGAQFAIMGGVNIGLALAFSCVSCVCYTKYRSKGSDDKKKMRR